MEQKDQLFTNMYQAALEFLKEKDPYEISQRSHVTFYENKFHFQSLGQEICISYPDYSISPQLDPWHILVLLHYLALADGTPFQGKQITFSQYKNGMIRGGGFDRESEKTIAQILGQLPKSELEKKCLAMGAELLPSNADFCAKFLIAPNYPVWIKLWHADDEFPASGRLLLDASAEHYLSIEDAVTVGGLILNRLVLP